MQHLHSTSVLLVFLSQAMRRWSESPKVRSSSTYRSSTSPSTILVRWPSLRKKSLSAPLLPLHAFFFPSSSFSVLKSKGDQFFINGNLSIDTPRRFNVAGTTFYYRRPPDGPETLEALGPTNMSLIIMVRRSTVRSSCQPFGLER